PMMVKDRQHYCVLINDAWLDMVQLSREELEGKHSDEVFPAGYARQFYEKDEAVFRGKEKNDTEEVAIEVVHRESKMDVTALCYKTKFQNDSGEDFLAISIIDITERKITEKKLAKSEQRFRALVENSSDFITILDAEGIFKYESPSFYRVTKFTEDQIIGQNSAKFIHPEDKSRAITKFLEAVANPDSKYMDEFRHMKGNGEWMTLEVIGENRLNDETIGGIVINSRDITDRKAAEIELQRSER